MLPLTLTVVARDLNNSNIKDVTMPPQISRRTLLQGLMASVIVTSLDLEPSQAAKEKRSDENLDYVAYVNILQGTNTNYGFSRGNTLPLVTRPFGMTNWTLRNAEGDGWFFDPNKGVITGITSTHQPSPWMGDYGNVTFMAQTGDAVLGPGDRAAAYSPDGLSLSPDHASVKLTNNIQIELTPTDRCSSLRFTYPSAAASNRVIVDGCSYIQLSADGKSFQGRSYRKSHTGTPANFAFYFVGQFDSASAKQYVTSKALPAVGLVAEGEDDAGAVLEFNAAVVGLKIGTSFISFDQATLNLTREIGDRSYDAVQRESHDVWNNALGAIQVKGGSEEAKRTFYSCFYRTQIFPRMFHEKDAAQRTVHYSPFDGKVHPGVMYVDSGLWDGYRTIYPLISLLWPEHLGEIVDGFASAYKEGGWLPQWPNPGYHGSMGGTHSDSVIADAFVKNIKNFDRDAAWKGLLKNCRVQGSMEGRGDLDKYASLGYIPADKGGSTVSQTLDYAYDDFCVSQVAGCLGDKDQQNILRKRALNYANLYSSEVGFFRAKLAGGSWATDFDQYAWGDPYTEGSAWQWTWSVPHDPGGLIALMGGQQQFLTKLDRMLWQPPTFHPGAYGQTIHEMREMAAVEFGQYDQGNQPVHHVLYLFTAAGAPAKTQYWARRTMDKLYSPDAFPGDEDNGEMAAWYVFNALGLYPLCPGHPSYVLGSPLFEEARIRLSNGRTLVISAPENSSENVYVSQVTLNGRIHKSLSIAHADLEKGGRLEYAMSASPVSRDLAPADLPFSLSSYPEFATKTNAVATHININCGGPEVGQFVADVYFTGGTVAPASAADDPNDLTSTGRTGAFTYTIPLIAATVGGKTTLRLLCSNVSPTGPVGITINEKPARARQIPGETDHNSVVLEYADVAANSSGELIIQADFSGTPEVNPTILHALRIVVS